MRAALTLTLSALAFLVSASLADAMTVSPLQVEMSAVGQRANGRVTVVNTSNRPLPVEAVIERLTLDENGKQKTQKAGEEFLIMPPQAMIPPGGTQNFRLQWLGDPMMERSQSFMLFINQIPVKMPKGQSGVQVVMGMGVMMGLRGFQSAAFGAPTTQSPAIREASQCVGSSQNRTRRHRHECVLPRLSPVGSDSPGAFSQRSAIFVASRGAMSGYVAGNRRRSRQFLEA